MSRHGPMRDKYKGHIARNYSGSENTWLLCATISEKRDVLFFFLTFPHVNRTNSLQVQKFHIRHTPVLCQTRDLIMHVYLQIFLIGTRPNTSDTAVAL